MDNSCRRSQRVEEGGKVGVIAQYGEGLEVARG